MIRKNDIIINFIAKNQTNELLPNFFDKCYDNLKDLNNRSEKFTIGLILTIFLYIIFGENIIESFSIGPINIKDISIIPKLLPILTIYVLFNLYTIENQKKDLNNAIRIYSYTFYKQDYKTEHLKKHRLTYITRLFLPYSFYNMMSSMFNENPSRIKALIGFIILLPIFLIGLLPFYFLLLMLISVFNHYYDNTLGFISFWLSIWVIILTMFYVISTAINENKEDKNFFDKNELS